MITCYGKTDIDKSSVKMFSCEAYQNNQLTNDKNSILEHEKWQLLWIYSNDWFNDINSFKYYWLTDIMWICN